MFCSAGVWTARLNTTMVVRSSCYRKNGSRDFSCSSVAANFAYGRQTTTQSWDVIGLLRCCRLIKDCIIIYSTNQACTWSSIAVLESGCSACIMIAVSKELSVWQCECVGNLENTHCLIAALFWGSSCTYVLCVAKRHDVSIVCRLNQWGL